jgi:hypothetical protein
VVAMKGANGRWRTSIEAEVIYPNLEVSVQRVPSLIVAVTVPVEGALRLRHPARHRTARRPQPCSCAPCSHYQPTRLHDDGRKPFDDPAKMHRLRRSFAKAVAKLSRERAADRPVQQRAGAFARRSRHQNRGIETWAPAYLRRARLLARAPPRSTNRPDRRHRTEPARRRPLPCRARRKRFCVRQCSEAIGIGGLERHEQPTFAAQVISGIVFLAAPPNVAESN